MKIHPVRGKLFHANRWADMTKLSLSITVKMCLKINISSYNKIHQQFSSFYCV